VTTCTLKTAKKSVGPIATERNAGDQQDTGGPMPKLRQRERMTSMLNDCQRSNVPTSKSRTAQMTIRPTATMIAKITRVPMNWCLN